MKQKNERRKAEERPLVSVVVPVYNVAAYLEDCLDSIVGQVYENLEIILVDDGSKDQSGQICDIYAEKDSRIRVVHQQNQGVVIARKNGILHAAGTYICFIDADDRIDNRMVEFFVKEIGSCDIITSACFHEKNSGEYVIYKDAMPEGIYEAGSSMDYLLDNLIMYQNRLDMGIQPYLCLKMFKSEIVKEAVKDVDESIAYSEDRDLLFRCILASDRIRITHESFYYYRYRPDSVMRKVNKNFLHDLNRLYLSLERAFEQHARKESLKHQMQLFITSRLYDTARFMGFSADTKLGGYVLPFSELEHGSKVVLYGAGSVGQAYYRQIYRQNILEMVVWVDREWKKYAKDFYPVQPPEVLGEYEYTYLIIAVRKEDLADRIRKELITQGIPQEKILWRVPAIL